MLILEIAGGFEGFRTEGSFCDGLLDELMRRLSELLPEQEDSDKKLNDVDGGVEGDVGA